MLCLLFPLTYDSIRPTIFHFWYNTRFYLIIYFYTAICQQREIEDAASEGESIRFLHFNVHSTHTHACLREIIKKKIQAYRRAPAAFVGACGVSGDTATWGHAPTDLDRGRPGIDRHACMNAFIFPTRMNTST